MENTPSIKNIAFTYGIGIGLLGILQLVLMYVLNLQQDNYLFGAILFIISIIIYVFGIKDFKAKNNGYLSLTQALKLGLAIAAIGGVIGALYSFIHYNYIYPEFIDIQIENAEKAMRENQPSMTEEQINQALTMSRKFTNPFVLSTFALIGTLFFGFLISLVAGLIMKKNDPALN
ncbi:DUF4199 domain-containing protein [Mesonia aquimarina]|uniref:DUF4199 domain-containing protein n=1 Tax=Mesonia aquimarina TaxID=1504967 RepID=UPI000EF56E02|nr:DUF4199 domain-containing protein [Mesonia aquimarina]